MQKTNFKYRLIIGEDCSKDRTREIVKKYQAAHPEKIQAVFHEKNLGAWENSQTILKLCTSKYMALCDGDDYWTDPSKLQKQIDFLEANPNYSLCFHDVSIRYKNRKTRSYHWDAPDTSDISFLLREGNYISTLSVVLRTSPRIFEFLDKFPNPPFGDYLFYIAAAQEGLLKFLPERMGVYRLHKTGSWSIFNIQKASERVISVLRLLYLELPGKWKEDVKVRYLSTLEELFRVEEFKNSQPDMSKLVIPEMGIDPVVIDYIKKSAEEKAKTKYYVKNIPVRTLLKALVQKPLNRLPLIR